jgi:hypothetical protein
MWERSECTRPARASTGRTALGPRTSLGSRLQAQQPRRSFAQQFTITMTWICPRKEHNVRHVILTIRVSCSSKPWYQRGASSLPTACLSRKLKPVVRSLVHTGRLGAAMGRPPILVAVISISSSSRLTRKWSADRMHGSLRTRPFAWAGL